MTNALFYIVTLNDDEPELIGPFTDGTEAVDFASEQLALEAWWVVNLAAATSPTSTAFTEATA